MTILTPCYSVLKCVLVNIVSGWSVIVTFSDPIAVGNVQVFNARYTEISTDSKTILFVSKPSHNVTGLISET